MCIILPLIYRLNGTFRMIFAFRFSLILFIFPPFFPHFPLPRLLFEFFYFLFFSSLFFSVFSIFDSFLGEREEEGDVWEDGLKIFCLTKRSFYIYFLISTYTVRINLSLLKENNFEDLEQNIFSIQIADERTRAIKKFVMKYSAFIFLRELTEQMSCHLADVIPNYPRLITWQDLINEE